MTNEHSLKPNPPHFDNPPTNTYPEHQETGPDQAGYATHCEFVKLGGLERAIQQLRLAGDQEGKGKALDELPKRGFSDAQRRILMMLALELK